MSAQKSKFTLAAATLIAATVTSPAAATVYSYSVAPPPAGQTGGYGNSITQWSATYDDSAETLSFSAGFAGQNISDDGFWMVLTGGPNPKGVANELGILYGDVSNGVVTAYIYNGANAPNSWQNPAAYLQSFAALNTSGDSYSFSINVSAINALALGPDWEGIQFGANIGIWYHPMATAAFSYGNGGVITGLRRRHSGWYDGANFRTQQVPAPASLALLGLGLVGIAASRRRRHAD